MAIRNEGLNFMHSVVNNNRNEINFYQTIPAVLQHPLVYRFVNLLSACVYF